MNSATPSSDTNDVEVSDYDPEVKGIQCWTHVDAGGSVPSPRCWFGSCLIGHKMYIFGGYNGKKAASSFLCDLFTLDLEKYIWTEIHSSGQVPSIRYAFSFTPSIDGKRIYLFGGAAGKYYYNSLYVLEVETNKWIKPVVNGPAPSPRCAHTAVMVGNMLYIHGGDSGQGAYLGDLYSFDTDTNTFALLQTTGEAPPPRGWHSVSAIDKTLYYFGGCNESRKEALFHDLWLLDTTSLHWSHHNCKNVPPPRYSHSSYAVGSEMVIIGGKYKDGGGVEVYWYNSELNAWWQPTIEGQAPSNRYAHCNVMYKRKLYLFGGFNGNNTFNDLYVLDIDPHRKKSFKVQASRIGNDLRFLVNNELFSDISFIVEKQKIYAHKNILVSRCEYFRSMFLGYLKEKDASEIVISTIRLPIFIHFINYIYTESLESIDVNEAIDLLEIANLYQYDNLKDDLSLILEQYLDIENCCSLLMHAHHHQINKLREIAIDFVLKNEAIVSSTSGYKDLDSEVKEMLS